MGWVGLKYIYPDRTFRTNIRLNFKKTKETKTELKEQEKNNNNLMAILLVYQEILYFNLFNFVLLTTNGLYNAKPFDKKHIFTALAKARSCKTKKKARVQGCTSKIGKLIGKLLMC